MGIKPFFYKPLPFTLYIEICIIHRTVYCGSATKQAREETWKRSSMELLRKNLALNSRKQVMSSYPSNSDKNNYDPKESLKQQPVLMEEHKKESTSTPSKDQPTLADMVPEKSLSQKEENALHQKVAEMVALDVQPYSIVEDRGFKALMKEVVPGYSLPSRTKLLRVLVPCLYNDTRTKVCAEMRRAFECGMNTFVFMSDLWTLRANESYLSLIVCFLTTAFEIKRFTLNMRHMPESHSAINIDSLLKEFCVDREVPNDCIKYSNPSL